MAQWFASSQVSKALKDYPRVILQSKGNQDVVFESETNGFSGGNFYIIQDYFDAGRSYAIWPWDQGTYNRKKDLLNQIRQTL